MFDFQQGIFDCYAECHYAECHFAGCLDTMIDPLKIIWP